MNTMKLVFFLLFTTLCYSQIYLLPNEELVFSFKTKNGKKMVLAKDKGNEYIIYRFGSTKKIELEYPSIKDKESWNKFTYSYYFRGGGKLNSGLQLESIYFQNENYEFTIYDDYSAEGESYEAGLLIKDITTEHEKDCKGIYSSKQGDLLNLIKLGILKESEKSR
ncbi:MAG: hypothetical protein WCJ62_03275 [Flavobacterium sp.]